MSWFSTFGQKSNSSSAPQPAAPVIRKKTVQVERKPVPQFNGNRHSSNSSATSSPRSPSLRLANGRPASTPASAHASPSASSKLSGFSSRRKVLKDSVKRKSASPTVNFGLSSDDESNTETEQLGAKRRKRSRSEEAFRLGPKRQLRDQEAWSRENDGSSILGLVQSADSTLEESSKGYKPAFPNDENIEESGTQAPEVSVQYPCPGSRERFQLVIPKNTDDYKPIDDVANTINIVLRYCLPGAVAEPYLDDASGKGFAFLLSRAFKHQMRSDFESYIHEFNDIVVQHLSATPPPSANSADGTGVTSSSGITLQDPSIARHLDAIHSRLPLPLASHILTQTYERTVSPRVSTLRRYEAASDSTYGELLPSLCSEIFTATGLTSSSVFLDLGSGVGNVALQAALEIGCKAYGVEKEKNPSELAQAQKAEFLARCQLWGLKPGEVDLWRADFLEDPRTDDVLKKADVVLVNNEKFSSDTNDSLTRRFLDLKEGTRIVSLKSFVPKGFKLTARTSESVIGMLEVQRREFWSGGVSWQSHGGEYFLAKKDSGRVKRFLEHG